MQIIFIILLKIFMVEYMKNRINMNNFDIHTDLIIDSIDNDMLEVYEYEDQDVKVSRLFLDEEKAKKLQKEIGRYITIEFEDITNIEDREHLGKILTSELKHLYKEIDINDKDDCLVVGLGNIKSTPDSLGPKVINNILVTRHLFMLNGSNIKEGMRCVSAFCPGVMGNTGIESADIILGVVEDIKPKFLIVIDALASNSIDRINRTIQITDSGIHPGSGIGNNRREISSKTIGIPVIAIGVPTVVDASTVIGDTIQYLYKHISYIKNNYNKNKLIFNRSNYLDKIKDKDLSSFEKKEVGGMLGELSELELKELFDEVLTSINYNMMVTVKEIDFLIEKLASVIMGALNNSLHKSVNNY